LVPSWAIQTCLDFNLSRILNPSPGSFLRNTCWQAGDVEVEAEDLDEALADARALRT
jgi:hypothetical protein